MNHKSHKPSILVVGSANMDMVISCERFPVPGETILAGDFIMNPGGKGANQAVAAAKLGGDVRFLGKIGGDVFGEQIRQSLLSEGVRSDCLLTDEHTSSGIAVIAVNADGQNQIMVIPGSNMNLSPADVEAHRDVFEQVDAVLLQLEIPIETVQRCAELAKDAGKVTILNPAPARNLPAALLGRIDVLTPNETEAALLTGMPVSDVAAAERVGRRLLEEVAGYVVITLGEQGAVLVSRGHARHFPARSVKAVDTTAAGDAFSGALAVALAGGKDLEEAILFAGAAGTLAVTRKGAQQAMPTLEDVQAFTEQVYAVL